MKIVAVAHEAHGKYVFITDDGAVYRGRVEPDGVVLDEHPLPVRRRSNAA